MHYVGGKGKVAARLATRILTHAKGAAVVEPFCGALAMTEQLHSTLASDVSRPVMTLIHAVRSGWNPPSDVSEQLYRDCKARKEDVDDPLVAFVGHISFGGKWFGGYARGHDSQRDRVGACRTSLLRKVNACSKTVFRLAGYEDLDPPKGALVYCDPPYAGTTSSGYWCKDAFDHDAFWQWVRCHSNGRDVIVSEYTAPEDFVSIFDLNRPMHMRSNTPGERRIEKLFIHESRATHETDSNIRGVDRVLCSEDRGTGRPLVG